MSQRLLNIGILLSFLACYLQWGDGRSTFVAQVEYQVLIGNPEARNFAHPMIAVPAIGSGVAETRENPNGTGLAYFG